MEQENQHRCHKSTAAGTGHANEQPDDGTSKNDERINMHANSNVLGSV